MRSLGTDQKVERRGIKSARILIVDDEPANVRLLERLLQQAGYTHLRSVQDPRQVLPTYTEFQPDIILLDLQMPHLDGRAVMRQLEPQIAPDTFLPILVLTADTNPQTKREALAVGAKDFLTKPFDPTEVLLRMQNLLETRFLHLEVSNQNALLEETVRLRTRALQSRDAILQAVSFAAERFLQTGALEQNVQEELSRLGEATTTSRVYIFENRLRSDGTLGAVPRFEWAAPGITPQVDSP